MAISRDKILSGIEVALSNLDLLHEAGHLDENTALLGSGIGLDSIEIIQLVAALEEAFGLTIDDNDLLPDHFQTIGSLIDFLKKDYL